MNPPGRQERARTKPFPAALVERSFARQTPHPLIVSSFFTGQALRASQS